MLIVQVGSGTRVGAIYYSNNELVGFDLQTHNTAAAAASATLNIPYRGQQTNTADTIRYVLNL